MRAPWLGDVLTDAGLTVATPVGNPVGRGRDMATIYGVVGHDTVTRSTWSDLAVARLLRDGHANLKGPLAQLGLRRNGTIDWIADGRCNHNGHGTWGNDAIGIEVYCAGGLRGHEEPWNGVQRETFVIAARAIVDHLNLGRSSHWNPRVAGHKETDRARKIDPYGVDMDAIRRQVAAGFVLADEEDDMPTLDEIRALVSSVVTAEERVTRNMVTQARDRTNEAIRVGQAVLEDAFRRERHALGLKPDTSADRDAAQAIRAGRKQYHDVLTAMRDEAHR